MAIISFYLDDNDEKLIKNYAKSKDKTVSSFLRSVVMESIEDDLDKQLYDKALSEFKENPQDVSLEDLRKEMRQYC